MSTRNRPVAHCRASVTSTDRPDSMAARVLPGFATHAGLGTAENIATRNVVRTVAIPEHEEIALWASCAAAAASRAIDS